MPNNKKIKSEPVKKKKTASPAKPKEELAASTPVNHQIDQLLTSQIDILKMINDFNTRLASVEMENQKLFHVLAMLTKNQDEFKGILDMLGRGMRQLKKQMEDEGDDFLPNEAIDTGDKKDPPLHDDVTLACSVCDKVYNRRLGKCPRCGFPGKTK